MKALKSFLFAVVSLVAAGIFMASGELKTAGCQEMSFDDLTRAEFKEYHDWKRVNRTPMVVRPNFLILDGVDN